ncbi:HAD-IIA family hydrolase [Nautilia sp.]
MKGFFIDVQGTLIDDEKFLPLPGSTEFLKYLHQKRIPYVLITNNTKRPSGEFKEYLKNLGFVFEHYLDPLMVFKDYLKCKKIAPYGSEAFLKVLQEGGYIADYKNPCAVVMGIKLYINEEISDIIETVLKGAELVGMHRTSLYSKNSRRYPGLGAVLEMIKYATGREYVTVGKPGLKFFEKAGSYLKLNYDKITIISDDLKGDLIPASELGMKTALVLSGKIKNRKEIFEKPDFVYENIGDLLNHWRGNGK